MKQTKTILAVILLVVLAGCGENKQSNNDLIIVDVSKSYPKKELILQDFMDVEYVALETTDEFLTQGLVKDVGKKCYFRWMEMAWSVGWNVLSGRFREL